MPRNPRQKSPQMCATLLLVTLILIAGCTTSTEPSPPPATSTLNTIPPTQSDNNDLLRTAPGPYEDATTLLDDVCFEALDALADRSWTLVSSSDLDTFFDDIDALELCGSPVARQTFPLTERVLLITIARAVGCDSAFELSPMQLEESENRWIIPATLYIVPGCDYDLLEPLVVSVPVPGDGAPVTLSVNTP